MSKGTPIQGDRAAWDITNKEKHANDLVDGASRIVHLPDPGNAGNIVVDDGEKWTSAAPPEPGEGDMLKSTYDTDDDGVVDEAAVADSVDWTNTGHPTTFPPDDHTHAGVTGDGGTFDAANLASGASNDGQVLTSDGSGGSSWEDIPSGSLPGGGDENDVLSIVDGDPTWSPLPAGSLPSSSGHDEGDVLSLDGSLDPQWTTPSSGSLPSGGDEGDVLTIVSGVPAWAPPSGGPSASPYPLDNPPGSPHAKDDEFNGGSLDVKWTDPATSTRTNTIVMADGMMRIEPSDAGSSAVGSHGGYGIRQVAPAGSFTVMAKVISGIHWGSSDESRCGLFVAVGDGSEGHDIGQLHGFGRSYDICNFTYHETADWSGYGGYNNYGSGEWFLYSWFKIVWDAATSTLSFYHSESGVFWEFAGSRTGMSQPTVIGVVVWSNNDIFADHAMCVDWFRVTEP